METETSTNGFTANSVKGAVSGSVTSRPILFSTEMVKAILSGRKTQTRRVVKPQPDDDGLWNDTDFPRSLQSNLKGWNGTVDETGESKEWKCPYGQVGDLLWVRETYAIAGNTTKWYIYKADLDYGHLEEKWKPSIFMPRKACRIELRIKSIRAERLNDITEADANREGVASDMSLPFNQYLNYRNSIYQLETAQHSFCSLWIEINGEKSWMANPFVWVIQFERTEMPSKHYR